MMWISPDGLGRMLTVDLNDPDAVVSVNPYAFGYRVFGLGKDGRYYSPYGYNKIGVDMGETVPAWYRIDEHGDVSSHIPVDIRKNIKSYGDLEKYGYESIRNAEDIPVSYGHDTPVADLIRENFYRLDKYDQNLLRNSPNKARRYLYEKLLEDVLPNGEKKGFVFDPNYDIGKMYRVNDAPHIGYSMQGIVDPRFSIPTQNDFGDNAIIAARGLFGPNYVGVNVMDRAFLDELVKAGVLPESDAAKIAMRRRSHGNDNRIFSNVKDKVIDETLDTLSDILPFEEDRRGLADFIKNKRVAYIPYHSYSSDADGGMFSPDRAKPLRLKDFDSFHMESLSKAIKGNPEAVHEAWDRFMRRNLISWIKSVLRHDPSNTRLVQVMVPLTSLIPNYTGNVSAQTDSMNELRALEMTLAKDIAGYDEFYADADKYFDALNKGEKSAAAWAASFGDKYGDLNNLNSDERLKDVLKDMRREVDDYISRKSVLHGLKRGPGDG